MKALAFWKAVIQDNSNFLGRVVDLLESSGASYCVIGGLAVNAYAEAVVTLDLDIVVAVDKLEAIETLLAATFRVERFPFSINVSDPGSDLRVQLQTDARYFDFVERATRRSVLGLELPVADIEDVLTGKIWAASDARRWPTKRAKDILDIARMVETQPALREKLPPDIIDKLPS